MTLTRLETGLLLTLWAGVIAIGLYAWELQLAANVPQ